MENLGIGQKNGKEQVRNMEEFCLDIGRTFLESLYLRAHPNKGIYFPFSSFRFVFASKYRRLGGYLSDNSVLDLSVEHTYILISIISNETRFRSRQRFSPVSKFCYTDRFSFGLSKLFLSS